MWMRNVVAGNPTIRLAGNRIPPMPALVRLQREASSA